MNLGRHNHGPVFFNDPWSGFYQLAAPFYTQAQFTQSVAGTPGHVAETDPMAAKMEMATSFMTEKRGG